jgi:cell division protein DivIC
MITKQTLSSKIAIVGLLILMVFLAELKFRQWKSQKQIETEKKNIQQQTDAVQKKNNDLNQSLEYLNSSNFKERVAREDLGLKKQGEIVYSFGNTSPQDNTIQSQQVTYDSNTKKWWNYFFSIN